MSAGNDREFIDHLQNKEGKEQAMKCPLLCIATPNEIGHIEPTEAACLKEECGWWVAAQGMCALTVIAEEYSCKLWDRDRPKEHQV